MIDIEFAEKKPQYFGSTGVHLYEVESENINGVKRIMVDQNANAIDLYKLYRDIIIFLSNQIEPFPDENNVKTYPVFGNPKHMGLIKNISKKDGEYQILGFLDSNDVIKVNNYLVSKELSKEENVQKYYDTLDNNIKEELQRLLDDRIVWELHGYFEPMVKFFNECANNNSEVVIIANS